MLVMLRRLLKVLFGARPSRKSKHNVISHHFYGGFYIFRLTLLRPKYNKIVFLFLITKGFEEYEVYRKRLFE